MELNPDRVSEQVDKGRVSIRGLQVLRMHISMHIDLVIIMWQTCFHIDDLQFEKEKFSSIQVKNIKSQDLPSRVCIFKKYDNLGEVSNGLCKAAKVHGVLTTLSPMQGGKYFEG